MGAPDGCPGEIRLLHAGAQEQERPGGHGPITFKSIALPRFTGRKAEQWGEDQRGMGVGSWGGRGGVGAGPRKE